MYSKLNLDIFLMSSKILLNSKEIEIILHRLACQLIENHNDFSNTVLIGLQPRGTYLANRLKDLLTNHYHIKDLKLGLLDITFYRDDFRRRDAPLDLPIQLRCISFIESLHSTVFNPERSRSA